MEPFATYTLVGDRNGSVMNPEQPSTALRSLPRTAGSGYTSTGL